MERKYNFKNFRGKHRLIKKNNNKSQKSKKGKGNPRIDKTNRKHRIMILIKNKMHHSKCEPSKCSSKKIKNIILF